MLFVAVGVCGSLGRIRGLRGGARGAPGCLQGHDRGGVGGLAQGLAVGGLAGWVVDLRRPGPGAGELKTHIF